MSCKNCVPVYKFALREDLKDDLKFLPTRSEDRASGWDVRVALESKDEMVIKPFEYVKIPLGFRAFCPEGFWYELAERSSTFGKKHIHGLYGKIDETFEGYLVFAGQYCPSADYKSVEDGFEYPDLVLKHGEAIGQIIPVKRQEMVVEVCSNSEMEQMYKDRNGVRGAGGFGSSDNGFVIVNGDQRIIEELNKEFDKTFNTK